MTTVGVSVGRKQPPPVDPLPIAPAVAVAVAVPVAVAPGVTVPVAVAIAGVAVAGRLARAFGFELLQSVVNTAHRCTPPGVTPVRPRTWSLVRGSPPAPAARGSAPPPPRNAAGDSGTRSRSPWRTPDPGRPSARGATGG